MLKLSLSSLWNCVDNKQFRRLVYSLLGYKSTCELEVSLLDFALQLGISVVHFHVEDVSAFINSHYPEVKIVIGSDGSHSVVWRQIFSDTMAYKYDLKYIADFHYTVPNDSLYDGDNDLEFSYVSHERHADGGVNNNTSNSDSNDTTPDPSHNLLGYEENREGCGESIGSKKTKMVTRCFVSKEEYSKIKDTATFKKPAVYSERFKKLAPCLCDTFEEKLLRRGHKILSAVTVTATCLNVYKSKSVVKQDDKGRFWLLVGDAAFAVPYFRALNDGLLAGSLVAKKGY